MFNRNELKRLVEIEAEKDFFTAGNINRCFRNLDLIKENSFDEEIVFAGMLLHSIGFSQHLKFNQDLIKTSENLSKKFLIKSLFPKQKTDAVIYCIQESGLNGKPKTPEAVLVHDSNLLDEASVIGFIKDSVLFNLRKIPLTKFLEEQKTKSFLLKESFFSEKAKSLSEKKISLLDYLIEDLKNEIR